ncbi:tRNA (cytidine(34)-2'-O)-methyltransferase [Corynebacterium hindlerae]|uniref:Putative tRNA (cytidine(34)-2'-O)-methyltransferase n=1 Tax=Corynebacterium hindlerae TaxID=699041 RepID=A0A7G5FIL4_9CORY|nr:tRNA (cytidine(34)-2'-O)-methyltransferase [Corynebacterium hindlerae]QMV86455.1 tRNA (cytidine(34)-2'-O)-methyltransferase [Corynebacterium hindlerae]QTH60307.1 tRNA (cytidine(34)-2'-O)-methyltransferase [Corynebacterium hindlerae]
MSPFAHIIFDQPVIPPNTGNAIRMCAGTGATLHLAGPLGFNLEEKNLRRAGLDYHDLAVVKLHDSLQDALDSLPGARVFAFSARATTSYTAVDYQPGDVLLFGTEPTGLSDAALSHPRITEQLRIPMLPGRRSMNLSNAAAVAAYEAWRQLGFPGA